MFPCRLCFAHTWRTRCCTFLISIVVICINSGLFATIQTAVVVVDEVGPPPKRTGTKVTPDRAIPVLNAWSPGGATP